MKIFREIFDEISDQAEGLEENTIIESVKAFYIPELLIDSKDQFSKMNTWIKYDNMGDVSRNRINIYFNDSDNPPLSVEKYEVSTCQITYFEQPQDITAINRVKEEIDESWTTYTYNNIDFALAYTKPEGFDKYLFNLLYYIDEKTQVYIAGSLIDNKNIDTKVEAIEVFKDFSCKTFEEALQ